jgi:hypothetical protein
MDHNKQGLVLLDKGDAASALVHFTRALIEHPTSPDYYSSRSKAFARLAPPKHELSLRDAETAVLTAYERGKRDKIREAQLRRVVALYNLGQYGAVIALLNILKVDEKEAAFNIWKAKSQQKLTAQGAEDVVTEVDEKPKLDLPQASQVTNLLKKQITADGTYDFETAEAQLKSRHDLEPAQATTAATQRQTSTVPVTVRQDWFQTPTHVTITLFAKGVDKEKYEAEIKDDSVSDLTSLRTDPVPDHACLAIHLIPKPGQHRVGVFVLCRPFIRGHRCRQV